MASATSINPRIIEGLYCEALVLSDEVRSAFASSRREGAIRHEPAADDLQIAQSCEALRATTRMMHAMAWLLNHRAFLNGELSEFQLRRHGRLADCLPSDPQRLALLDPPTRALVRTTERFHARLRRIDNSWRDHDPSATDTAANTIARLRERIAALPTHA